MNALLVENPAIYLNCREAMSVLGIAPADSVIIVTSIIRKNLEQLRDKIIPSEWAGVHFPTVDARVESVIAEGKERTVTPPGMVPNLLFLRRNIGWMKNFAATVPKLDTVLCGVYGNEMALSFCQGISYERYVLVDDGNMTMFTAGGRAAEARIGHDRVLGVNSISKYGGLKGWLKLFVKRQFLGARDRGIPSITFFTSHHQISCQSPDTVIPNRYSSFMQRPEAPIVHGNRAYVLGAPILERNILREDEFIVLLEKISRLYAAMDLTYFPHRMETERSLKHVRSNVKNVDIRQTDLPFEGFIGSAQDLPAVICSFYSSALTNLQAMDLPGVTIHVIRFPWQSVIDPSKAELVKTIYENLAERQGERLKIIEVDLRPVSLLDSSK